MKLADLQETLEVDETNPFYISFSDLMVMLCVFFVMILGMSNIEIGSFEKIKSGFSGSTKGTLVELANQLKEIAEKDPGIPGVEVRLAEDGVRLDLDTAALFDTASSVLKPHALDPIEPLLLKILATDYKIDIEGHTDDRPFFRKDGEEIETNWSLSGKRASRVVFHLTKMGFKGSRLRIVGYASTKPRVKMQGLVEGEVGGARAKNRRVSLLVK
jgi:chemotaxis protein MotB